jgi:hypothetical protein
MDLLPIENPGEIAAEAIRIVDQLRILEKISAVDTGRTDQSDLQRLHGVFEIIDTEMGKLKLSCLSLCMKNSHNHQSGAVLYMLDELTKLSGQFNNLTEQHSSIPETLLEEQIKLIPNQKIIIETKHCLEKISRRLYAWRQ